MSVARANLAGIESSRPSASMIQFSSAISRACSAL
jgi:hypothetical protein